MPEQRAEAGQVRPEQVDPPQISPEEETLEEDNPAEAEWDFFAPFAPPELFLIVSRSELIRARRENRLLPFELPPNWPPPGWKSHAFPREDSVEGLRQWLELLTGPRGVLCCTLGLEQKTGRPSDASAFAHDTWLLVEHLEARGLLRTPHNLERRSHSADQALDVLGKLRKELFGPKPQGGVVETGLPATPSKHGDVRPPLAQLREFAANNLKGIERRVVELVCDGGGKCTLADLAADKQVGWNAPWDDAFNSARRRINDKLKNGGLPWRLWRRDNAAVVQENPGRGKIGRKRPNLDRDSTAQARG